MTVKGRFALALALGAVGTLSVAAIATGSHPRPKGATPVRVSLVPAFEPCTAPNRTHGPPLAHPSCNPPAPASRHVTIGTPDVNGAAANFAGFIRMRVLVGAPGPPDDSEVVITASISDVRCRPGKSPCGNANADGGPDYAGQLEALSTVRVTDHYNAVDAGGGDDPATVVDIPFPVPLDCVSTADTSRGSDCTVSTNTCLGCPTAIRDGKRTVVGISQVRVFDGGSDGIVATTPNTSFATQGLFVP